jgi:16S rRNA (cytosine967-C5)-methyltransferase
LLLAASTMVRPGGRLVYSVCTLTRAETTAVDDWARAALADFSAGPAPGPPWRPWGRGALLLPQAAGTDGMYLLSLSRSFGGRGTRPPSSGALAAPRIVDPPDPGVPRAR